MYKKTKTKIPVTYLLHNQNLEIMVGYFKESINYLTSENDEKILLRIFRRIKISIL